MAIGRFPVVEPAEVAAIVAKTVRHATTDPTGPWRRHALFVTNEEATYQRWSDRFVDWLSPLGFASTKLYPEPAAAQDPTLQDQAQLRHAFDAGQALVHFVGHGGRFIWRTGPADWTKHRDLFTLDDVDRLNNAAALPVVLSMTCYSAPFDHPTADSIGEKLLRVADRGAVAVIAASWRNSPTEDMSRTLIENLLTAPTVGEALLASKLATRRRDFIHQYNLLGDPALRLPLGPELTAAIRASIAKPAGPEGSR